MQKLRGFTDWLPESSLFPQVILLSHNVLTLYYLESTDQLWILDGNQAQFQTVMILNEASQIGAAVLEPLLPEHSVFDAVSTMPA